MWRVASLGHVPAACVDEVFAATTAVENLMESSTDASRYRRAADSPARRVRDRCGEFSARVTGNRATSGIRNVLISIFVTFVQIIQKALLFREIICISDDRNR